MKQYFLPLALATFLLSSCGINPQPQSNQGQTTTPSAEKVVSKKSLRDLLSLGVAQKCSWSFDQDGETMTGEIIFSGQKFRQNAIVKTNGKETKSSVSSDGAYVFIWNEDDKSNGLKMKVDSTDPQQSVDWDQQYNYNCSPTTVSDAEFTPPSGITFTDLSELQDQMKNLNLDALKKLAPTE